MSAHESTRPAAFNTIVAQMSATPSDETKVKSPRPNSREFNREMVGRLTTADVTPPENQFNKLVSLSQMGPCFGLYWSRMTFWRKLHAKEKPFPAPIRIANRMYWRYSSVANWIAEQEGPAQSSQGGAND
jgi:predicted DNA-binding transcriptional regulator AlpA